ncbi:MAG: hypothetical protein HY014_18635 [Acidobacteria bacterium]|nr:hypothetical protein [Acidobacteriota bacterium]MBI3490154.1 hypothetical protein [Acidobacteriota bacterium]
MGRVYSTEKQVLLRMGTDSHGFSEGNRVSFDMDLNSKDKEHHQDTKKTRATVHAVLGTLVMKALFDGIEATWYESVSIRRARGFNSSCGARIHTNERKAPAPPAIHFPLGVFMIGSNPNWHFSKQFHSLNNAELKLVPYEPSSANAKDRCVFCSIDFHCSAPGSLPFLAFTTGDGRWVCQACHCEHKDDFNWPTNEWNAGPSVL